MLANGSLCHPSSLPKPYIGGQPAISYNGSRICPQLGQYICLDRIPKEKLTTEAKNPIGLISHPFQAQAYTEILAKAIG
jgi:hypothetical protein